MHASILSTIGNTPLVELRRMFAGESFRVFAKLEAFNPGGSIKDRPALAIMEQALEAGLINHASVIVESSSGNMGVGLAQVCRYHGLCFICVVDPRTSARNVELLRAYGAEIDRVTVPGRRTGEFLEARIERVQTLLRSIPNSFWPNQYANLGNPGAHHRTTMREVAERLAGRVDLLFVATSTCGTLRGCCEHVREHRMPTRIVAVDALGSQIFSDVKARRLLPGLGAAIKPPLLAGCPPVDECIHVTDLDCVVGCRRLMAQEAILAGGSSGGVLSAVAKMRDRIARDAVCVAILPDRGERYLETVFDDAWVGEHLGDVLHLWQQERSTAVLKL